MQAHILNNRGTRHYTSGQPEQAIALFTHAIAKHPEFALAFGNRATAQCRLGSLKSALADAQHALDLFPAQAEAWNTLGTIHTQLEAPDNAIECFNQALNLKPTYASAYINRALTCLALGKREASRKDLEQATALDSALTAHVTAIALHHRLELGT